MAAILSLVIGAAALVVAVWGLVQARRSARVARESAAASKSSAESAERILQMAEADQARRELVRIQSCLVDMQTLFRRQVGGLPPLLAADSPAILERNEAGAKLMAALQGVEPWRSRLPRSFEMSTCGAVNWTTTRLDQALVEVNAILDELPAAPDGIARIG